MFNVLMIGVGSAVWVHVPCIYSWYTVESLDKLVRNKELTHVAFRDPRDRKVY